MSIHTLQLHFDLPLQPQEVFDCRGAFIHFANQSKLKEEEKSIFSNRQTGSQDAKGRVIERYPKIQYRVSGGKAAIWSVNDGVIALDKLMRENQFDQFTLYGRPMPIQIVHKDLMNWPEVGIEPEKSYEYICHGMLPFNEEKEIRYQHCTTYHEKITLLEQILLNEAVLLTYALGIDNQKPIHLELTDIVDTGFALYKTKDAKGRYVELYPRYFTAGFRTNFRLPKGISLGRHKAYGYGQVQVL